MKEKNFMRVFIVDDSVLVCERLKAMLSELKGIEIIGQAQDPVEATKSILRLKPDLVILDIRMPGGSGIDVLERIKKDESAPIVIILTNYLYPQYRRRCTELGAEFFFDKSSEFEKVSEVIKKLLHNFSRNYTVDT
jgi:DNA-binding NarL/FixJ family response regulator